MNKSNKTGGGMDPARVALLFGLSVGLGIVIHESFFLVAGAIAVGAAAAAIADTIYDHTEHSGLKHQHR
jgi:hypothetical protein